MKKSGVIATILSIAVLLAIAFIVHDKKTTKLEEKATEKISICTSIYPMYDFAKNICGDYAEITCLVPIESDFREYTPQPSELDSISDYDIFIYSGKGADSWAEAVIPLLEEKNIIVVNASENISEESPTGFVWLNPNNALLQMQEIYESVITIDPDNKSYYSMNINISKESIKNLNSDLKKVAANLPDKEIFVTAPIYDSLCLAYDLKQTTVTGMGYHGAVIPENTLRVKNFFAVNKVTSLFTEPQNITSALKEITSASDVSTYSLDPFVKLIDKNGYFDIMKNNIESLNQSLILEDDDSSDEI